MRSSCNGCRVLRKGCGENCTIRPCLEWIKTPESQAQATLFLAKFYGRTGLLNLIHAGPDYLRPAVFKSLLYEACGRIVNPTHGSVGLLWSGEWAKCQAAVEAVLAGTPIMVTNDGDASHYSIPVNSCDVRHLARDHSSSSADGKQPLKKNVVFKRASAKSDRVGAGTLRIGSVADYSTKPCQEYQWNCLQRNLAPNCCGDHEESLFSDSAETGEASLAYRAEPSRGKDSDFRLELTLALP